jgi:hypothetical protein
MFQLLISIKSKVQLKKLWNHTGTAANKILEKFLILTSRNFHFENQIPSTDRPGGFLCRWWEIDKRTLGAVCGAPGRCVGECVHPYPGHGSRRTDGRGGCRMDR